jgi:Ca2+-binding RTX toxin-like protein
VAGGVGDDWIDGGAGNDLIFGDVPPTPNPRPVVKEIDDAGLVLADLEPIPAADIVPSPEPIPLTFNDTIWGGDGDDRILAQLGADFVSAGNGNDFADGGDGNDDIYGGIGNDVLRGGTGNDFVKGGSGNDDIGGGPGADILHAADGEADIIRFDNDDQVFFDVGEDTLIPE